jgi:hypothetical protein
VRIVATEGASTAGVGVGFGWLRVIVWWWGDARMKGWSGEEESRWREGYRRSIGGKKSTRLELVWKIFGCGRK